MIQKSDMIQLNRCADVDSVVIDVDYWAVVNIVSDTEDEPYDNYIVVDKDGTKYFTGSESFWNSFKEIWDIMGESTDAEPWALKVFKADSKNRDGQKFITCSII